MDKARRALIDLIKQEQMIPAKVATVTEVDTTKLLIDVDPLDGGPTMFSVRLAIGEGGSKASSVVTVPKNGSTVLIGQMQAGKWYLIQAEQVESIMINGDGLGGLVNWPQAKLELDKMSARIDTIETAIKTGVPIPQDGGVGYQLSMKGIIEANQIKESFENLENEIVKHG